MNSKELERLIAAVVQYLEEDREQLKDAYKHIGNGKPFPDYINVGQRAWRMSQALPLGTGFYLKMETKQMIDYNKIQRGDIVRLINAGAPNYAELGDLLRITEVFHNGVRVEDKHGKPCEFVYNCGAARLETTEWTRDFPAKT